MVYGIVGLELLCNALKGYCGKRVSSRTADMNDSFLFSLLRMLFCILIGAVMVFAENAQRYLAVDAGMLAICVLAGLANAAFLVGWLLAVQKNTMVSVGVGLTFGSLIPSVLCALLFGDEFSPTKMFGFALIVLATVILSGSEQRKKRSVSAILLLLLAAVGDGIISFAQQLYRRYYTDASAFTRCVYPKTVYHFYTYAFTAVILLAALLLYRLHSTRKSGRSAKPLFSAPPRVVMYIFVMAMCLFAANYLQTVATNDYGISSQVLYPFIKGGDLVTINFVAMIFFGEKITLRSVLGLVIALGGLVTINVL